MLETGRIDQATHDAAVAEPLVLNITRTPSGCQASAYALYCAYVRDQLLSDPVFGATPEDREESLYRGGLTVTTALSRSISDDAAAAAARAFEPSNRVADGVAVVEPGTGFVAALAQSKPYGQGPDETEIVYATRPAFQPGSTFKAITLANALEQGFDPRSTITSNSGYRSRVSDNPASGSFRNSGGSDYGAIDAYEASKKSVNTFYVQLIERYGVEKTADMAARLGITSLPRSGDGAITARSASLTLGAYETSPLQMASAYAAFAANGVACRATGIVSAVRTTTNTPVDVPATDCHQAVSVEVAKQVTDILQGGFTPGGTAAGRGINRPEFGKTGTTNSNAATWFVGATPQYATAVWVGDPRGGTRYPLTRVTAYGSYVGTLFGATVAARVWQDAMGPIHEGLPALALGTPNANQGALRTRSIPDVRGMTTEQAATALLAAGYQVALAPATAAPDPLLGVDRVALQDPAGGVDVTSGALVTLTLTSGSRTDVELPQVPLAGASSTERN
jgi:membrane peptidoglycan carboxypeptidase